MKIVVLDGHVLNPGDLSWDSLRKLGEVKIYERSKPEEAAERIGDAEAILINKVRITEELLAQCPNLRYIGVTATGYNTVDVAAARSRGIVVTNVPAYSTDAVAQLVFAFLLEICHHVGEHSRQVQEGAWCRCPDFSFWSYPLMELRGKTLGIIGFGNIGRRVAELALAFGMEVLYYCRHPRREEDGSRQRWASLEEIYRKADVISLHCPLTAETEGLINKEALAAMKPGVILINTARGPIVEEEALAAALTSGQVAWAGVDVVRVEPMEPDNPLLGAPNCLITPHFAAFPVETRERLLKRTVENLAAWQAGRPIHVVS